MWGFHFRPSYSELWKLAEFGRPILAMTGTATKRTEDAILKSLRLPADTVVVTQCSNRPNLLYHVLEKKSDGKDALVELIKKEFTGQCGIVYCVERSDTVDIAYRLKVAGIISVYFHAGMDVFAKQKNVENWKSGGAHVMCATVAFGMGIDKPNVRFVIHHSASKDLESYVQESGRLEQTVGAFGWERKLKLQSLSPPASPFVVTFLATNLLVTVRLARFTHSHDHPKGLLTVSLLSLLFCWAIILSSKYCSIAKTEDESFQTLTIVAIKSEADKRIYSTICVG